MAEREAARPPRQHSPDRRERYLRKTYGISLAEWTSMTEAQGGRCAICSIELDMELSRGGIRKGNHAVVDHDHATGKVRGVLCNNCNRALGMFGDSVDTLMSAAAYLLQHQDVLSLIGAGESGA